MNGKRTVGGPGEGAILTIDSCTSHSLFILLIYTTFHSCHTMTEFTNLHCLNLAFRLKIVLKVLIIRKESPFIIRNRPASYWEAPCSRPCPRLVYFFIYFVFLYDPDNMQYASHALLVESLPIMYLAVIT